MSEERNATQTTTVYDIDRDGDYGWFHDGQLPHSIEDLIAEAIALAALLFALGIGLVIAMLPVPAHAATTAPSLELSAFRIVAALPGQPERLVSATEAHAGDRLEYKAVYRNPTDVAVHHVTVTVPVPATGVAYVLDTASPHADLASRDGKTYSALPLTRVEAGADGRPVVKPAPGGDYRFLRWDLGDVPAGATRTVSTRVQLLPTSVTAR